MGSVLDGGRWEWLGASLQLALWTLKRHCPVVPPSRPAALTALRAAAGSAAALPVDGTVRLLTTGAPALGVQPAQGSHLTNNRSQHREGPKMYD